MSKNYNKYHARFTSKIQKSGAKTGKIGTVECSKLKIPSITSAFNAACKEGLRIVNTRKLEAQKEYNFRLKCLSIWQAYNNIWQFEDTINILWNHHARGIGTQLYDITAHWTGFCSKSALELPKAQRVNEHFYPRQWAGSFILKLITLNKGIDFEHFIELARVFRQVHHTTGHENTKLRDFQKDQVFDGWEHTYIQANIELVADRDNALIIELNDILGQLPYELGELPPNL